MQRVNCVIVTYNRLSLLRECVEAVCAQTFPLNKIIVVNNASTDGTVEYLAELAREGTAFDIVTMQKNTGGAGGFNAGLKRSFSIGADWSWLMDDDTIPYPDTLQELVDKTSIVDKTGFVSSRVLWTDGSLCKMNISGLHELQNGMNDDQDIGNKIIWRTHCTFVSVVISHKVIEYVGFPLKEFFIWDDDIEYTKRITRGGFFGGYTFNSKVIHKMVHNNGSQIETATPDIFGRFYYQQRNGIYVLWKESYMLWVLRKWIRDTIKVCRQAMKNKHKDKWRLVWLVFKGRVAGLFFRPKIEYPE